MKLLTKEIEKRLQAAWLKRDDGTPAADRDIVVKFFNPTGAATWWIVDGEKTDDGDWLLFGYADLGDPDCAELGYVSLRELQSVRVRFGLGIERDIHFDGHKLGEVIHR